MADMEGMVRCLRPCASVNDCLFCLKGSTWQPVCCKQTWMSVRLWCSHKRTDKMGLETAVQDLTAGRRSAVPAGGIGETDSGVRANGGRSVPLPVPAEAH